MNVAGWIVTWPTRVDDNGAVPDLQTLGWDESWDAAFEPFRPQGLGPARVAVQHRGEYDVLTEDGERRTPDHESAAPGSRTVPSCPSSATGSRSTQPEPSLQSLPRRTTISRRAAHEPASGVSREQVVAANVDIVFVVQALGQELDRRLLERYLALAVESGARPVVVLTKADLEPEHDAVVAGHWPTSVTTSRSCGCPPARGSGLTAVQAILSEGTTGALLGPSGVGKSTLVNALVGDDERLATAELGADGAGRHTTTRRELVLLPGGGMLVDNPGMREVHLWVEEADGRRRLRGHRRARLECRFADCRHETEPGCAVLASLEPESWRPSGGRATGVRAGGRGAPERLERRERSRARR